MDENLNQSAVSENPYSSMSVPSSAPTSQAAVASGVVYASFFERLVAVIIDQILVGIFSFVFGFISGLSFGGSEGVKFFAGSASMILSISYYVYFISQKGATIGKQAMKIRVQKEDTGENLDVVGAILRELVGKFISGAVLLLGYFWMLWDPKKQTWHDKIAKSIVVKAKA
jgi:uncharacterized RDD family membrane protein YckC